MDELAKRNLRDVWPNPNKTLRYCLVDGCSWSYEDDVTVTAESLDVRAMKREMTRVIEMQLLSHLIIDHHVTEFAHTILRLRIELQDARRRLDDQDDAAPPTVIDG